MTYISGPMRGYKNNNFEAFDEAKAYLLAQGYQVISPADMDRQDNGVPMNQRSYAKRDLNAVLQCKSMFMLKGWEKSIGALAEHAVAVWIGLHILYEEGVGA